MGWEEVERAREEMLANHQRRMDELNQITQESIAHAEQINNQIQLDQLNQINSMMF